jgi:hypothetical protein
MSSLRSVCSGPAKFAPAILHIVAAASAPPVAGVRRHSACPVTRAEAAHARMLEALRDDFWVRMRLESAGFDDSELESGERGCVCRSFDAAGASSLHPAANDASRGEGRTHACP